MLFRKKRATSYPSIRAVSPPPEPSRRLSEDESSTSVDRMKVYDQFVRSQGRNSQEQDTSSAVFLRHRNQSGFAAR